MAVHQVEEYYVFIQFKKELTNQQRRDVVNYLENTRYNYRCSSLDVDVENLEKEEAESFDFSFSEEFSNLIK